MATVWAVSESDLSGRSSEVEAPPGVESNAVPDRSLTALGTVGSWLRSRIRREPTEEERSAVEGLLPKGPEFGAYVFQFSALTVLSAAIASFGLLADSSAVVIGAMLVAPLMTPISAAAAATVTVRNRRLFWSLAVIALGTALAIFVGWFVALVAGGDIVSAAGLPGEVRSRTFPGLLDLGVAISAGAAAGYILPRGSAISALPGVGIAVALVPPLAVVGITLEAGLSDLSRNAFLLYLTNLAAIIFSVAIMLLIAGFRPREEAGRVGLSKRLLVTLLAVAAVAIPLTLHTRATLQDLRLGRAVVDAVEAWDGDVRIIEVKADVADGTAAVDLLVASRGEPRPAWQLAVAIRERFGGAVELRLFVENDELFEASAR